MTQEEIKGKAKSIFREADRVFSAGLHSSSWCVLARLAYDCVVLQLEIINETIQIPYMTVLKHFSFTEYTFELVGFSHERPKHKTKSGDPFAAGDEIWDITDHVILKGCIYGIGDIILSKYLKTNGSYLLL